MKSNNERIQQLNIISRLLETKLKALEHIDQQVPVRRRTNSYRNRGIGEVCRKGHYIPEENKQCLSDVTVRESEDTRDFKQIATAGANTAAGSKFPPK